MNILVIAVDTLRADHVSCYGYRRKITPFLDEYAKNVMSNVYNSS